MNQKELLSHVDHTLLTQTATWAEIRSICDQGVRYGCASVCIPPSYVRQAADYLRGRCRVCTVIGFPNGYATTASKVFEARDAVSNGADEIDMVVNLGWVRDQQWDKVLEELRALRRATEGRVLKVIIETCLLTEAEKLRLCQLVTEAQADYIKTSTGFSTGGAVREDVALLTANTGPDVKVKAAGGISSLEDAEAFLELGADRLGTSRVVRLISAAQEG